MKALKTYGIHNLLEWHGTVHSNGVTMKVDFTNGSTTAYGVAPATFMTKDEVTQHIIENSNEFKSGRIKLIKATTLPDEQQEEASTKSNKSSKVFQDITKTQDAIAILTAAPYHCDAASLKSKQAVHSAASALGISFPNL